MDIKQYITSGILELYVLDRLEPAARREVESNALLHPDIREEIDLIEQTLEAFSVAAAPEVSPGLLDRILSQPLPDAPAVTDTVPAAAPTPAPEEKPVDKVPKVPVEKTIRNTAGTYLAWALAALGLATALYFFFSRGNLRNELNESQQTFEQLQSDYSTLQKDCEARQTALVLNEALVTYLSDPTTRDIQLASSDNASDRFAMVFYNPEDNRTVFRGNRLPPPPAGKQYQLWAIDGEGPKSLGVLDLNLSANALLEMPYLPDVAAFAITLEDLGGKPAPDLEQLQVIGNV